MASAYETKLQAVLDNLDAANYTIHTTKDGKGENKVKCSPSDGEKALRYSFSLVSPPMAAKWADLHGEGTLGTKYAPERKQAKFKVSLVKGNVEETAGDKAATLVSYQTQFLERVEGICKEIAMHIYNDPALCAKKKKSGWVAAKQAVAIMKKTDANTLTNDDPDVQKMHVASFLNEMNPAVKRDGEEASITVKKRVYGRENWKDANSEEVIKPVPITDPRGALLNEDNAERCVANGDLISAKFRLEPYILPNGTYGVSFDLTSLQKIRAGPLTGRKHKADVSWDEFEE
jgi:hypothetical protein